MAGDDKTWNRPGREQCSAPQDVLQGALHAARRGRRPLASLKRIGSPTRATAGHQRTSVCGSSSDAAARRTGRLLMGLPRDRPLRKAAFEQGLGRRNQAFNTLAPCLASMAQQTLGQPTHAPRSGQAQPGRRLTAFWGFS